MIKISILTGTRAEYGLLRKIMMEIRSKRSLFELQLIVTGSHLSNEFGQTVEQIIGDGFRISSKIPILSDDDSRLGMVVTLGKAVDGIGNALARLKPDVLLILGDRLEVIAAALAATYLGIPIAHIHGGDVSGSVDQPIRYAITKLAHIHFVATHSAAIRLKKVGEESRRIFVVGAPGLDDIVNKTYSTPNELETKYGIELAEPLMILLQHPLVTEQSSAICQIEQSLKAVEEMGIQSIIISPNSDAGGRAMIRLIKEHCRKFEFLKFVSNMPRKDFLGLMAVADVMVGNSSSGIIEAPSFGLPVVNIGQRQAGRERGCNVIDIASYNKKEIKEAITKAISDKAFIRKVRTCRNPYGTGHTAKAIVNTLRKTGIRDFWPKT